MEYFITRIYQSSLEHYLVATWVFLVWICPYPMRVMYLLDLVQLFLDGTHKKLQTLTKNYSVAI